MITKPHGIFTIENKCITIDELDKTLDRLMHLGEMCKQGYYDGVWTWQECFIQMTNYVSIMKNELRELTHKTVKEVKKNE